MASSTGGPSGNQVAEVVVRLSAIDPHPTFEVPERSVVLDKNNPTMSIGRASKNKNLDCDMANCWFDSPVMSRKHAQLEVDLESKTVFLVDTGSLHGTFLNDRRLGKDERVELANNDEAKLGVEIVQGNKTFPPCRLRISIVWADGHLPAFPPPVLTQITPTFRVPDADSDLDSSDPYTSDSDVEEILSVPRSSQQQNSVIDLTQDTFKPDVVDLTSPAREPSPDLDGPASPVPDTTLTTEPALPPSQHPAVEMPMSDAPPSPMSPSYSPLSPDFRRGESVDSQELDLGGYSDSDLESVDDEHRSIEHSSPPQSPLDADNVEPINAAVPLLPEFPARTVAIEGLGVTDTAVWGEDDSGVSENDESTESDPEYDSESLSDSDDMNEDDEYESEDEPMLPPLESVTGLQTMGPVTQPEAASLILPPLMDNTFPIVRQPSPSDAAMPKTIRTRFPGLEVPPSTADVLGLKTGKYDFFVAREANKKLAETYETPRPAEPSGDVDYGMPHNFAFPGCTMPCIQPSSGPSPFPTLEATTSDFRIAHLTSQTQPNIQHLLGFANYQASPNMPGTSSFRKEGANEMSMHNNGAFVSHMQVNNTMPSGNTDNVTQTPKRIEHTMSPSQQDDSRCTHVSIGELVETTQAMESTKDPMTHFREDSPVPQQKAQGFPGDAVLLSFMDNHRRRSVSDLPLAKSREASPVSQDNSLSSESRQASPDSCDDDPLESVSAPSESRENSAEPHNLSPGFAPAAPEILELPALVMSSPTSAPEKPATPLTPESLLRMANPGAKRKRTEEAEEVVMPATRATPAVTATSAPSQMRPTEPEERLAKKRRTTLEVIGYAAVGAIGASVTLFAALVATAPNFD